MRTLRRIAASTQPPGMQGFSVPLRSLPIGARITFMLIPQFSLRWLLALTTVCAVVFSIVGLAVRGSQWAVAVSVGIGSAVVVIVIYGLVFALVWVFSVVMSAWGRRRIGSTASPFQSEFPPVGPAAAVDEVLEAAVPLDEPPVDPEQA